MKRMNLFVIVLVAGLAVCGWLVLRHARRVPMAPTPPPSAQSARDPRDLHAVDVWQAGIKLDPNTDYTPAARAKQRLMEKLRREEEKQRPQEGRN